VIVGSKQFGEEEIGRIFIDLAGAEQYYFNNRNTMRIEHWKWNEETHSYRHEKTTMPLNI
jgi:hypothetical protein